MKNFNKMDSQYALTWAKKIKAVNLLGGKCQQCGNKNFFVLDFHHEYNINKDICVNNIKRLRWSKIEKEVLKCKLLCANCHCELHCKNKMYSIAIRKKEILDLMNNKRCCRCGYQGENFASLCFHHVDMGTKNFNISQDGLRKDGVYSLEDVLFEINKCELICANCHRIEHTDIDRFNSLKDDIYYKVNNYQESKSIDRNVVEKMKKEGKGICEIARRMGINKSSIFYYFHKTK